MLLPPPSVIPFLAVVSLHRTHRDLPQSCSVDLALVTMQTMAVLWYNIAFGTSHRFAESKWQWIFLVEMR